MKINVLNLIRALNGETQHKNKKGKNKGCFGGKKNKFIPTYTTLKVIPKSKRTPENCNEQGIAKS